MARLNAPSCLRACLHPSVCAGMRGACGRQDGRSRNPGRAACAIVLAEDWDCANMACTVLLERVADSSRIRAAHQSEEILFDKVHVANHKMSEFFTQIS